ncbi:MAG: D-alanyl-D-alanine carboxypeptidase/D-alanyl-D-alanine-endopeptidase [Candidatus Eisenbacteria bacterium]
MSEAPAKGKEETKTKREPKRIAPPPPLPLRTDRRLAARNVRRVRFFARRRLLPASFLALAFLLPAGSVGAAAATLARPAPGVAASVAFAPIAGGSPAIALDENRLLPPASVAKIVTTAAALDLLGPGHRFVTRLWADGPLQDGRLEGNLYLSGEGDPFLVHERLWLLAHEAAAATGLREVAGDLVVHAPIVLDLQEGRSAENTDSPYAAPVSILAVDFNNLFLRIRAGSRDGAPAEVFLDPFPIPGVAVDAAVTTSGSGRGEPVAVSRRRDPAGGEVWVVRGSVGMAGPPGGGVYRSCSDPAMLAGGILRGLLAQNGVSSSGSIRGGAPPVDARVLAEMSSLPLGEIVRSVNGYSNNLMADLLLVDIGEQGSAAAGSARVAAWFAEAVPASPAPRLVDGSGLSVENRISAAQLVALLQWAAAKERVFPDLYASLPRPGDEGTLERRFREGRAPSLRAKTGTLGDSGVSSIAGYLDHPDGTRWAFAILQQASPSANLSIADLRKAEEAWIGQFLAMPADERR